MYDPLNVYKGKYREFIESIMIERPINERFAHSSKHHVIPTCCGGKDNDDENIRLYMTHTEHFIAHRILSEDNPDNHELFYAYWRMCNGNVTKATPEEYEEARLRYSRLGHSERTKEKIGESLRGIKKSDETRLKMSESKRGVTRSPEDIKKISDTKKGIPLSEKNRENISKSLRGRSLSDEHRKNIAQSLRNSRIAHKNLADSIEVK